MKNKSQIERKLKGAKAEYKKISKQWINEKDTLTKDILRDLGIITYHEIFVLKWVLKDEGTQHRKAERSGATFSPTDSALPQGAAKGFKKNMMKEKDWIIFLSGFSLGVTLVTLIIRFFL